MILSVPFCPSHFVRTILSVPFCPYHFVPYHFVLEPEPQKRSRHSTDTMPEFHAEAPQARQLPKVPTWRLERDSNPRPSGSTNAPPRRTMHVPPLVSEPNSEHVNLNGNVTVGCMDISPTDIFVNQLIWYSCRVNFSKLTDPYKNINVYQFIENYGCQSADIYNWTKYTA